MDDPLYDRLYRLIDAELRADFPAATPAEIDYAAKAGTQRVVALALALDRRVRLRIRLAEGDRE